MATYAQDLVAAAASSSSSKDGCSARAEGGVGGGVGEYEDRKGEGERARRAGQVGEAVAKVASHFSQLPTALSSCSVSGFFRDLCSSWKYLQISFLLFWLLILLLLLLCLLTSHDWWFVVSLSFRNYDTKWPSTSRRPTTTAETFKRRYRSVGVVAPVRKTLALKVAYFLYMPQSANCPFVECKEVWWLLTLTSPSRLQQHPTSNVLNELRAANRRRPNFLTKSF